MGKYFGTDGFRGVANQSLMVDQAFKVGRYLGYHFHKKPKAKIIIGKDTRLSGSMLESALAAGITASGTDVELLGVCPTPAIAYLVKSLQYDCGVMISASHNPYHDNGIKVFNREGMKLQANIEDMIEAYVDGHDQLPYAVDGDIGVVSNVSVKLELYLDYLASLFDFDLSDKQIVCDLANGSATATAVSLLKRFNAQLITIADQPDGVNINTSCGSTHPEQLISIMKSNKYDLGLAFDGDADRLIAVDDRGDVVDGDKALYVLAKQMIADNKLKNNTVVTTVMSNFGLYKIFEQESIAYEKTAVGDKYVYECMVKNDHKLGGEQSGHIIFKDLMTTGDGLLTAMKLLETMVKTDKRMSELVAPVYIYPQLLINVKVKDKNAVLNSTEINQVITNVQEALGNEGRILVRPSGTEPLIRVMVEAKSNELCASYTDKVVNLIKSKGL
ncbi:MAG: phosphoglucosamine mutase [Erysipelotrichaceae bacterium]|nr:phosphoglucosamine mutase [Erysipelotrichaceae bacterium]